MVSLTLVAIMGAFGLVVVAGIRHGVEEKKLRKDVSSLNSAVKIYLANGGSLEADHDLDDVLAKLKTVTSRPFRAQMVGLKGSALDPRMRAEMQTPAEAKGDQPRAIWDRQEFRFVVSNEGENGVKRFVIDSDADVSDTSESRSTNLRYAKQSRWVWDYVDRNDGISTGPDNFPYGFTPPGLAAGAASAAVDELAAPIIGSSGGSFLLRDYPMTVTVSNPNTPASSEILYSVLEGVWSTYDTPILIEPGVTLDVIAVSDDPFRWSDSSMSSERYAVQSIAAVPSLDLPSAVNYIEVGGPLMVGSYPRPGRAPPGSVGLANAGDIPDVYESSSYFKVFWTFDGSDPLQSAERHEGDQFGVGFPGQEIPLLIERLRASSPLKVTVRTESLDPKIFSHSAAVEKTIAIDRIELSTPLIETERSTIAISFDVDTGEVPVGARIYYTVDGTDPGVGSDGEPLSGTAYQGPFELYEDAEIVARVYAPSEYPDWFIASESSSESFVSPYEREVMIAGRFSLPDGRFRNIARLGEDGRVDASFNPGLGASYGSVVTAIAQASGGKYVVGGDFDTMDNVPRRALVRLKPNGRVDLAFDAGLTNITQP